MRLTEFREELTRQGVDSVTDDAISCPRRLICSYTYSPELQTRIWIATVNGRWYIGGFMYDIYKISSTSHPVETTVNVLRLSEDTAPRISPTVLASHGLSPLSYEDYLDLFSGWEIYRILRTIHSRVHRFVYKNGELPADVRSLASPCCLLDDKWTVKVSQETDGVVLSIADPANSRVCMINGDGDVCEQHSDKS